MGLMVMPGWSRGTRNKRDAAVLGLGIGARPHPVPLGEVGRGGPRLLAVEPPPVSVARRLQLHRRRVGPGVGLGVPHRELDLVAQDLREELGLELLRAVTDDRLADDADALADLGTTPARQGLVQEVLVEAVALLAAVGLGPGDAQPSPPAHLGHEGSPGRGVDDLGHVLPGEVEDLGVVVLVEETLDLLDEGKLLRGELEVHGPGPSGSASDTATPPTSRRATSDCPSDISYDLMP